VAYVTPVLDRQPGDIRMDSVPSTHHAMTASR
jgi:hypothetical protein